MAQAEKDIGLSPERIERIKAAQQRHAAIDPACVNLTPEEFINWHPVGMSWEERARRMKAAGIVDPDNPVHFDSMEERAQAMQAVGVEVVEG